MKCPKCSFENPVGQKFCNQCGKKLEVTCQKCGHVNVLGSKFCGECGCTLKKAPLSPSSTSNNDPESFSEMKAPTPTQALGRAPDRPTGRIAPLDGERKHATVMFSDLSGYTAMSEKLDPEKVKDIMERIFAKAAEITEKYDARVEKFFGDEIMIIFGVPKAHEDDPVRAVNVALEIHEWVEKISPSYEKEAGVRLRMHTGINTGLVITGDKYIGKSRHGLTGDTINLAKRLTGLAKSGDIVVGADTFHQSSGYFDYEALKPATLKGKADPVQAYRVVSQKEQPRKVHRLQGVRAGLIGRKMEIAQLKEAVTHLKEGKSAIFSIVGTAGTGKSRLVEEFKNSLNPDVIQWREGHAYPYTQNIPYFPLMNMLSRDFGIREGDAPEKMKAKIEKGVTFLMGENHEACHYIGSLFSLSYSEIEAVSPEFWKSKLQQSIQSILYALAKKGPTIVCLEDLHWADPSFLELIRYILSDFKEPVIFICIYRPLITLFSSHQLASMAITHHEIHLQDLSTSESQDMLESLLETKKIPDELRRFVQSKVEGNPFYLEEVINSFIESGTLIRKDDSWQITRAISKADISASINSLISARLDRLAPDNKWLLQQAAVIGRAFYYDILKKITHLKGDIDRSLSGLERLDLIKTRTFEPDLEYIFKHAITQEVVYNGLLKKERRIIHENIGTVIEKLFESRLPEFYETLAFHFSRGQHPIKAIDYLVKAGEKSLAKYSLNEAHLYFQKAFDIVSDIKNKSTEEKSLLIHILSNWGYAYYYLGDVRNFLDLFASQQDLAESVKNKAELGMFYVWYGIAYYLSGQMKEANKILKKALAMGDESNDLKVQGYAFTWLSWSHMELGAFQEATESANKAQQIAKSYPNDQYLFFKSLMGLCYINYPRGNMDQIFNGADSLLKYGSDHANSRCLVFGHWAKSFGYFLSGDMDAAIKSCKKSIDVARDPFYSQFPKLSLGLVYLLNEQDKEARDILQSAISFFEKHDVGQSGEIAQLFLSPVLMASGELKKGLKLLESTRERLNKNERNTWYALSEYIMGKVYSQIAIGPKPGLATMAKNIGFLAKNVPTAAKKAEDHFNKAIELSEKIGAKGFLGFVYMDLGLFYKTKKRNKRARKSILSAIDILNDRGATIALKQAQKVLQSL